MKITATNKATGEQIELQADTHEQIVDAWNVAREYEKAAKKLKNQLKKLVPSIVGDKGMSEPINGYMFRISNVQLKNYDKTVLREVFDEDALDLFLEPNKKKVDDYLKEHLDELGEASTRLRNAMVDVGQPYEVIKLEKLYREEL